MRNGWRMSIAQNRSEGASTHYCGGRKCALLSSHCCREASYFPAQNSRFGSSARQAVKAKPAGLGLAGFKWIAADGYGLVGLARALPMVTRLSPITPSPTQRRMPLSPLYRQRSSPWRRLTTSDSWKRFPCQPMSRSNDRNLTLGTRTRMSRKGGEYALRERRLAGTFATHPRDGAGF